MVNKHLLSPMVVRLERIKGLRATFTPVHERFLVKPSRSWLPPAFPELGTLRDMGEPEHSTACAHRKSHAADPVGKLSHAAVCGTTKAIELKQTAKTDTDSVRELLMRKLV
ncbi:hypothetical protein H8959_018878 [Pygathrix nigripes]